MELFWAIARGVPRSSYHKYRTTVTAEKFGGGRSQKPKPKTGHKEKIRAWKAFMNQHGLKTTRTRNEPREALVKLVRQLIAKGKMNPEDEFSATGRDDPKTRVPAKIDTLIRRLVEIGAEKEHLFQGQMTFQVGQMQKQKSKRKLADLEKRREATPAREPKRKRPKTAMGVAAEKEKQQIKRVSEAGWNAVTPAILDNALDRFADQNLDGAKLAVFDKRIADAGQGQAEARKIAKKREAYVKAVRNPIANHKGSSQQTILSVLG